MSRRCQLTRKSNNAANNVSHSKRHTRRVQRANIISKRLYLPSERRWVRVKLSTAALRTIEKVGVEEFLKKTGVRL